MGCSTLAVGSWPLRCGAEASSPHKANPVCFLLPQSLGPLVPTNYSILLIV